MNSDFIVKNGLSVKGTAYINSVTEASTSTTAATVITGGVGIGKKVMIGSSATVAAFPNAQTVISTTALGIQKAESHNIGLLAEGTGHVSNTAIYGVGVYGIGYTNSATRCGGVIGEGHVTASADVGSAIGIRGYANDTHAGGANIGLYGDATNGATNYALYMNNGGIFSSFAQTWTLSGNLTITGASLVLGTALSVISGGTGVTTSTGTGNNVLSSTPTLTTPILGVAQATSINKVTITPPATSATITITDAKTLTVSNTLTFTGTDTSSVNFGTGGTVIYAANNLSQLASTTSAELASIISDETGSGSLVFGTSPAFTTSITTPSTTFSIANSTATTVNLAGAATSVVIGAGTGTTSISNNLYVAGNITFGGTSSVLSATNLSVTDALIYQANTNAADITDIGTLGKYNPGAGARYSGLVRDASDSVWKLFSNLSATPTTVVDFTSVTYASLMMGALTATTGAFSSTLSATRLTSTIATGTSPFVVTSTTPVANLSIGGNAATVTTNANLTGVVTSVGNATSFSSTTGSGAVVLASSPALVTPTLGVATATSINKLTLTAPATTATLTIADNSSLITVGSNAVTLTSTGITNVTLPTTGTLVNTAVTALSSLSTVGTIASGTWSGAFGTVSGANLTNLSSANLTGTIPSLVLGNSIFYLGTTAIALNRASGSITLAGVNISGSANSINGVAVSGTPATGQFLVATNNTAATWQTITMTGGTGTVSGVSAAGNVNGITLSGNITTTGSITLGGVLSDVSLATQVTDVLSIIHGGTGSSAATGTGTTVLHNAPVLVAPTLGSATATSINKVIINAPAVAAALTLGNNSTFATIGGFTTTLISTGTTTITLPTTGTLVSSSVSTLSALSTVGTIVAGTWNATPIESGYIGNVLTGKSYNGITPSSLSAGFTLAGGTSSKTLTVNNTIALSGTDASTLNIGTGGTLNSIATATITGTPSAVKYLRGDNTWATPAVTEIIPDNFSNSNFYLAMTDNASGSLMNTYVANTKLYFNPSTGIMNATSFNQLSDITLKKNVSVIANASSIIRLLVGKEWNWKSNDAKSSGVIAQELEKILPFLVDGTTVKSVNYSGLIGYLIEGFKELDDRLSILESK